MDAAMITQLIGSVGFPIACCIAMGYYVHEETNKQREQISEIEKRHRPDHFDFNAGSATSVLKKGLRLTADTHKERCRSTVRVAAGTRGRFWTFERRRA